MRGGGVTGVRPPGHVIFLTHVMRFSREVYLSAKVCRGIIFGRQVYFWRMSISFYFYLSSTLKKLIPFWCRSITWPLLGGGGGGGGGPKRGRPPS